MQCNDCTHRKVCTYLNSMHQFFMDNKFNFVFEFGINNCRHYSGNVLPSRLPEVEPNMETTELVHQYDKTEDFIKDFSKRSDMIKQSYKDASGSEIVCPTCKSKVSELFKCVDCGKPVCEHCGIVVTVNSKEEGLMCEKCWTEDMMEDDQKQESAIKIDIVDADFLKGIVRQDIPEK